MQKTKMSLANIQGKLSRVEMKKIMAGSGGSGECGNLFQLCNLNTGLCYRGGHCVAISTALQTCCCV